MKEQVHKEFLIAFGKKIKKLRNNNNITCVQMAFELGCNEKQIRLIEKGEINTGILSIYKIATVLEIAPKDLLDFEAE